ncbi:MAG: hypothetical protein AB7W37_06625 [Syntrophobacteraceae bacterium]
MVDLLPESLQVVRLWGRVNEYGREGFTGAIRLEAVVALLDAVGAGERALHRLLDYEGIIRTFRDKAAKEREELERKKGQKK